MYKNWSGWAREEFIYVTIINMREAYFNNIIFRVFTKESAEIL